MARKEYALSNHFTSLSRSQVFAGGVYFVTSNSLVQDKGSVFELYLKVVERRKKALEGGVGKAWQFGCKEG